MLLVCPGMSLLLLLSALIPFLTWILNNREGTEHPRAYIVPSPSRASSDRQALARDIVSFVAERLAKHKHITGGVVFRDAIPKNPSGKILRKKLREEAKEGDGKDVVYAVDAKLGRTKAKL